MGLLHITFLPVLKFTNFQSNKKETNSTELIPRSLTRGYVRMVTLISTHSSPVMVCYDHVLKGDVTPSWLPMLPYH